MSIDLVNLEERSFLKLKCLLGNHDLIIVLPFNHHKSQHAAQQALPGRLIGNNFCSDFNQATRRRCAEVGPSEDRSLLKSGPFQVVVPCRDLVPFQNLVPPEHQIWVNKWSARLSEILQFREVQNTWRKVLAFLFTDFWIRLSPAYKNMKELDWWFVCR